jgi:hypothetical protein
VAAEKVSFPNFLPKAVAESFLKDTVSDNERILKTPNLIKIGGVDFAWVEIENIERNTNKDCMSQTARESRLKYFLFIRQKRS